MSAQELKRRTDGALDRLIEDLAGAVLQVKYAPNKSNEATLSFVLETNAYRRGVEHAKGVLLEEYTKFVAPDSIPGGASEEEELEGKFYQ